MKYVLNLLAHNGVAGANAVEPFAGHSEVIDEYETVIPNADQIFTDNDVDHDGRIFSFAYIERDRDTTTYFYREKRTDGEPSDWAKARVNA